MKKQRPFPWVLGLGMLDLTHENVRDVKCALPGYYPLPFKAMGESAILALGAMLVAMDLARWQPLRAWWVGELARRGKSPTSVDPAPGAPDTTGCCPEAVADPGKGERL